MIKVIIQIIFLIVAIGWLSEVELSFRPFSIRFPNWRQSLGVIIICIGIGVYYSDAYRKGWNKAIDKVIEVIDEQKNK